MIIMLLDGKNHYYCLVVDAFPGTVNSTLITLKGFYGSIEVHAVSVIWFITIQAEILRPVNVIKKIERIYRSGGDSCRGEASWDHVVIGDQRNTLALRAGNDAGGMIRRKC